MRCPKCADLSDKVVDSRLMPHGDAIRRRRACEGCGHRYTTYERVEVSPVLVVKKNGQREEFQRDKLLGGLRKALHRRPVSAQACDEFVRGVEQKLAEAGAREVATAELGGFVMEFLRREDHIAYIRYASVYKDIHDIADLLDEVRQLAAERPEGGKR